MEASDFRNGVTFVCDGQPCQVIEFQHVKPGKGAAFVRTKYKNIITGAIRETSFNLHGGGYDYNHWTWVLCRDCII